MLQESGEAMFRELKRLSPGTLKEKYFVRGEWDMVALDMDLEFVLKCGGQCPAEIFKELQKFSPGAVKEDYFSEATKEWDLEGLLEDLELSRAQHPAVSS
ncbi:unnamed protein product [Effrenium voratum]|nr:unnamed protein product [Effrenium voratum]